MHDFQDSNYLNDETRYEASLPLKESHLTFPDNYPLCENQLLKLYGRLKNNVVFLKNYDTIFVEQREAGTTESVESTSTLGHCHYIAHHPVFRDDKKLVS